MIPTFITQSSFSTEHFVRFCPYRERPKDIRGSTGDDADVGDTRHDSSILLNFIGENVARDYRDIQELLSDAPVRKPIIHHGESEDASCLS
jgi:hypothetical protein